MDSQKGRTPLLYTEICISFNYVSQEGQKKCKNYMLRPVLHRQHALFALEVSIST